MAGGADIAAGLAAKAEYALLIIPKLDFAFLSSPPDSLSLAAPEERRRRRGRMVMNAACQQR